MTWLLSLLTWGRSEGKSGRLPKSYQNLMFLSPFTACPPTFHKKHAAQRSKKEFNQRVWNKILNIKPAWHKFQEHGNTFYLNIDYRWKTPTGCLKVRHFAGMWWFQWNQDEKVAHFGKTNKYAQFSMSSKGSINHQWYDQIDT